MPVTTDYTNQIDTFQAGIAQQYRLLKYMRDLLENWTAQPQNIKDRRLKLLFFDSQGNRRKCFKIGTAFDKDSKWAGTTPSVTVSLGNVQYVRQQVNLPGLTCSAFNRTSITSHSRQKIFSLTISVVTQDYDATILLAQLIQMFLTVNSANIVRDCSMLQAFDVLQIDAPAVVETQAQSKQVYGSVIQVQAVGYICWTQDTQGPVFRGIENKVEIQKGN